MCLEQEGVLKVVFLGGWGANVLPEEKKRFLGRLGEGGVGGLRETIQINYKTTSKTVLNNFPNTLGAPLIDCF